MLEHRHAPRECGVVFASFKAFQSPLRHQPVSASCSFGTHRIWWELEADTEAEALAQLPQLRGGADHRYPRSARCGCPDAHRGKFRVLPDVRKGPRTARLLARTVPNRRS